MKRMGGQVTPNDISVLELKGMGKKLCRSEYGFLFERSGVAQVATCTIMLRLLPKRMGQPCIPYLTLIQTNYHIRKLSHISSERSGRTGCT